MLNHVTDIKKGNEAAFLAVYHQFHVKVFHYFLKRTRVQEVAKDLTQQTFIKLWQSRHNLSESHTLDTQFFTIANSIFIDHLRRQAVERRHYNQLQSELAGAVVHAHADYESSDYLHVVSEDLPPVRKNVFILKVARGYSNKEIAEHLSVSIKTVEDHYSKALRHIRGLVSVVILLCKIF